jgi:hypothetical protein
MEAVRAGVSTVRQWTQLLKGGAAPAHHGQRADDVGGARVHALHVLAIAPHAAHGGEVLQVERLVEGAVDGPHLQQRALARRTAGQPNPRTDEWVA